MTPTRDELVKALNELIETMQDGIDGYHRASEDAAGAELPALLQRYADQRATFKTELQALVVQAGGTPETEGSTLARIHRGWIDLKSKMAGRDNEAILEECERGDEHALKEYDNALNEHADLPAQVRTVLQTQRATIQQSYDHVRTLEEAAD